jgi:hypothetical protein
MVEKWISNPVVNAMHAGAAIKLLATWGIIRSKMEDNRKKAFLIDSVLEINCC